mmetsp:Transcript_34113/g.133508  ORF Transcript_34113/g.133508 Transcript_34113/m.133508 type:complete len:244 (-) Transcript_34113:2513-3244(-)
MQENSRAVLELPDDILVAVIGHLGEVRQLMRMRSVSSTVKNLIDQNPILWRNARFDGVSFAPKVCLDSPHQLFLRHSDGRSIYEKASSAGNPYARLVERIIFQKQSLYSITVPESLSAALIENRRKIVNFAQGFELPMDGNGMWIGVHSAACLEQAADSTGSSQPHNIIRVDGECTVCIPTGSVIGLVHVEEVVNPEGQDGSAWIISQSIQLRKPIQCAGFDGIWKMSEYLSEVILRGAQASS